MAPAAQPSPAPEPGPAARTRRWRDRIIPDTVLGMAVLILAFAIGAAASGVTFYSYYEFKKDTTEKQVSTFVEGFGERFDTAVKTIEAERDNAKAEIQKELEPIKQLRAEGETLDALMEKVQAAVWFVRTLDEAGQPSVGSAFSVASDSDQTLLVASFATVRAATRAPGPQVFVRKGEDEVKAVLYTWHEQRDLALLVIDRGGQAKLPFVPSDKPVKTGERIFAVSGLGAAGGAITQGFVADVSSAGIQSDLAVGTHFQGGPVLNSEGQVLAMASRAYAPLGFVPDGVTFAVPVRTTCEKVLKCPGGNPGTAGDRQTPAPQAPPTTSG